MGTLEYRQLIETALQEDLGDRGDITSQAMDNSPCEAVLLSRDQGILAGADVFTTVFKHLDPRAEVEFYIKNGQSLKPGDRVARIQGHSRAILAAERTALNFLSFLSGIATQTRILVDTAARHGRAEILDTRKTLPGFRVLSKQAVRLGGGKNHRQGLYDMVLIKDNHIDLAGSITRAVEQVRSSWGDQFRIEVECRNLAEVEEALAARVEIIMLDNMDLVQIKQAVALVMGKAKLEVSGRIDREQVKILSSVGIDYISVGRITHSAEAFDFSLNISIAEHESTRTLDRISDIKKKLGSDLLILGHYYMHRDVLDAADIIGDSYLLSLKASRTEARYIVFCGVSFMAESARILCKPDQKVFIPEERAGCPLANMITAEYFSESMEELTKQLGAQPVPVLYVNSSAEVKALVGEAGGVCCTSSNAALIVDSLLKSGKRVFFLPDQNLGYNVARSLGISNQYISSIATGRSNKISESTKIVLWDGFCVVHQRFSLQDVRKARSQYPDCRILVHPECLPQVVEAADFAGSTSQLFREAQTAAPGAVLFIGTEINFVQRLQQIKTEVTILPLRDSKCANMAKITMPKLLSTLEGLSEGLSLEEVEVEDDVIHGARQALERMIDFVEKGK